MSQKCYLLLSFSICLTFIMNTASGKEQKCSISGVVIDTVSDSTLNRHYHVYGSSIVVLGTKKGAIVGMDNTFCIKDLEAGEYVLKFSNLAYISKTVKVEVNDSSVLGLKIYVERKHPSAPVFDEIPYPSPCPDIIARFSVNKIDSGSIKGVIFDSTINASLPHTKITLMVDGKLQHTYSDLKGVYELSLPVGKYELSIENTNNLLSCELIEMYDVNIIKDSIIFKNFYLNCMINDQNSKEK